MKITSRFFDTNDWSLYATLQTLYIIIIMRMGMEFDIKMLALASIIFLMEGSRVSKLIYVFFLCLITWPGDDFIRKTAFTILATLITSYILYDNKIHKLFIKNVYIRNLLWLCIWGWFGLMLYLLKDKLF